MDAKFCWRLETDVCNTASSQGVPWYDSHSKTVERVSKEK